MSARRGTRSPDAIERRDTTRVLAAVRSALIRLGEAEALLVAQDARTGTREIDPPLTPQRLKRSTMAQPRTRR